MKTSGAAGGVNGAEASTVALPLPPRAVNVCCVSPTAAHAEPRENFTAEARVSPALSFRPAVGTSAARLNSLTAEPSFGGTNDATMHHATHFDESASLRLARSKTQNQIGHTEERQRATDLRWSQRPLVSSGGKPAHICSPDHRGPCSCP